ncbi:beta-ketoacyl synthase N-terminal-like domain-containing protein [Streptomyces katrae]|uniref:Beta-ketoacyl synthase N-terminal-like domain-containing protein n=1 Tax=Streptomyces katrae TaxID=68223 RepID=A0ABT7GVC2_9ACTN|nr:MULTISPECIES: beta-ketoacyl synthase N-terminal-like domain-containing protein [Streptomyces]MDK9497251.1 beta-ketoacyl synthase N-terminal-like domain-containing protein [Streptomyces katrae]RST05777.1 3-oxoacyl-ACP synthase [Streptomyces sp. WAC07149]
MSTAAEPRERQLVISGWAVSSPYGLGRRAFAEGLLARTAATAPVDTAKWPVPYEDAGLIPGFDIKEVLGRKGTRSMDRATGIAVVTVGELLEDFGRGLAADPEKTGLVLGTSGSVQSIMDFTKDALTGDKPYLVDPARFPNTVMNCPTGQSAIRHTLKGPNVTVSGGSATGLLALNYASRLLRGGHANALLAGAAEEYSVQRARLERVADHGGAEADPLGEGAALFLLESGDAARDGGRQVLATVLGSRFRAFPESGRAGSALARCVEEVLADAGAAPEDVALVAPGTPAGLLGKQEESALDGVAGERIAVRPLVGDATAASAAFQLAAVLAHAGARPALVDRLALVTAIDRDGTVGATLLRLG